MFIFLLIRLVAFMLWAIYDYHQWIALGKGGFATYFKGVAYFDTFMTNN